LYKSLKKPAKQYRCLLFFLLQKDPNERLDNRYKYPLNNSNHTYFRKYFLFGTGLRTVIKIGTNSQSIEHHHHHIHHLGNGACVDNTPFMTPAQSVENFYNVNDDMLVEDLDTADEALSVAGTEYSEAPSVARSYTISQHSNQVGYLSFFVY
jgi:hypothetical protein